MSATFDPDKICWFDTETKSNLDLAKAGAYRYATDASTSAIILTYAIGRGETKLHTAFQPGQPLTWFSLPEEFLRFIDVAAKNSEYKLAAFNAGFDRAILNYTIPGSSPIRPTMIIDPAVQATAAGLPPDLAAACRASGSTHKVENGDKLIALFCAPGAVGTPQSHPAEWAEFTRYAVGDVDAMRSLFLRTRQLPLREWEEYWAMEMVNERGIGIDFEFAKKADKLAKIAKVRGGEDLARITGGVVKTVGQVKPLTKWLLEVLPPDGDGIKILTKREAEVDDDGEETRPPKYSLTRQRIEKLIPYCEAIGGHAAARALSIRLYGGSTTPAKYSKIMDQEVDGCLFGQYVFNGAPQTGRASSRGVQIQNLARAALPYEHEAIEAILGGCNYDQLAALGDTTPAVRKLALLIRPTFVPRETGNVFVVSDFAQIEARVLPFLADSPGGEERLQLFRDIDADPSLPDLYQRTAGEMAGGEYVEKDDPRRQTGKIAELALGFGGGAGALISMAANYGMYFDTAEAKDIVMAWRRVNPWCVRFWGRHSEEESYGLWGAANRAMEQPGRAHAAGRIRFVFVPEAGNTLYCQLPSGRCLTYRGIKYERVADYDDDDNITGYSTKLRFWKRYSRSVIWHGTFCENVVQATAADLLRGTLVRAEKAGLPVRLHSHDEILVEASEADAPFVERELRLLMRRGFDWSKGLPIMSEETIQPYYSKWKAPKVKKMEAAQ